VVEVRQIAVRVADEETRSEKTARRNLQVLARIDREVAAKGAAVFHVVRVRRAELVTMSGERPEFAENRGVTAVRSAHRRVVVAQGGKGDLASERILSGKRVVALLVADSAIEPMIAIEWITQDAEQARLAILLMPVDEIPGRIAQRVEGPV